MGAKSLGLGVGSGERAKQLVPTPEGPGIVERLRVGVSLGSIKQSWVGVLAAPPTSCVEKLPHFSDPWYSHLYIGNSSNLCLLGVLLG